MIVKTYCQQFVKAYIANISNMRVRFYQFTMPGQWTDIKLPYCLTTLTKHIEMDP